MKDREPLQPARQVRPVLHKPQHDSSSMPASDPANGLSDRQNTVLRMQQQHGNAYVRRYLAARSTDRVQRAVVIDEMSSNFEVRDGAKVAPGVRDQVKDFIHNTDKGNKGDAGDDDMTDTPDAPADDSTLDYGSGPDDETYV